MTKDPKRSTGDIASASEILELRGRALLILSAIERQEVDLVAVLAVVRRAGEFLCHEPPVRDERECSAVR